MSKPYNGFPSWNSWNSVLWLNNDYDLYQLATEIYKTNKGKRIEVIAHKIKKQLEKYGMLKTQDGGTHTIRSLKIWLEDQIEEERVCNEC